MADNTMIGFGLGLIILGIIGLTLQLNPIADVISKNTELINENLEVIHQSSILAIILGLFLIVLGKRRKIDS